MHTHTLIGLTLSLDSLLKNTSQAKLSEHDPLRISQTEDTDAKPVTGQMTASSDSTTPDSTHSHGQQSKDDSTHTSDSTHHSRSIDKSTSTRNSNESHQSEDHTDSHDTSTNESRTHYPMTCTSIDASVEPVYKAIIRCHDKLVTALSTDVLSISNTLFAKEFIPDETFKKMLLPTLPQQEKQPF